MRDEKGGKGRERDKCGSGKIGIRYDRWRNTTSPAYVRICLSLSLSLSLSLPVYLSMLDLFLYKKPESPPYLLSSP